MMFSSCENPVIGFNSSWKTEKIIVNKECQTSEYKTKDEECCTSISRDISTQTSESNEVPSDESAPPPNLSSWLQTITPMMLKELSTLENSTAFKNYDPYQDKEETEDRAKLIQSIQLSTDNEESLTTFRAEDHQYKKQDSDETIKLPVVKVCWSQSGNSLAVGCGFLAHDDWCLHDGFIYIYIKSPMQDILKMNLKLSLPACVSDISYHPVETAILAAGSVAGDLYVWNMQQEASSPITSTNRENHPIRMSSLLWLATKQAHNLFVDRDIDNNKVLVTGSINGSVTIWLVNTTLSTMTKYKRFSLNGFSIHQSLLDITCMDFLNSTNEKELNTAWHLDAHDIFAIGSRTGQIILCQISPVKNVAGSDELHPVFHTLEQHGGCILSLSFSSAVENLLLTLGADLEIRIYKVPQNYPVQVICLETQLSSAVWIPKSSNLVVGTVIGNSVQETQSIIKVFDVNIGKEIFSADSLDLNGRDVSNKDARLFNPTSFALNLKSPYLLCCGDASGFVYIWKLPTSRFGH